jgi:hypothetical protein
MTPEARQEVIERATTEVFAERGYPTAGLNPQASFLMNEWLGESLPPE